MTLIFQTTIIWSMNFISEHKEQIEYLKQDVGFRMERLIYQSK